MSSRTLRVTLTMPLSMRRELSDWLRARDVAILSRPPSPPEAPRS